MRFQATETKLSPYIAQERRFVKKLRKPYDYPTLSHLKPERLTKRKEKREKNADVPEFPHQITSRKLAV